MFLHRLKTKPDVDVLDDSEGNASLILKQNHQLDI
jgi:hypothetical protein